MDITWNATIVYALLLGSFSYGISLVFFIKALEGLGSFRTGMFFSLAPFIGAVTSLILLQEWIGWVMFPAIILTVAGVWLISTEEHEHLHLHEEEVHTHLHNHNDNHHIHEHEETVHEPHIHEHKHLVRISCSFPLAGHTSQARTLAIAITGQCPFQKITDGNVAWMRIR